MVRALTRHPQSGETGFRRAAALPMSRGMPRLDRPLVAALATLLALVAASAASARPAAHGRPGARMPSAGVVRGTVVSLGWSELTVQHPGRRMSVVGALTHAADAVARGDFPYVWGGGHAFAGIGSIGVHGGPGYNGRRIGFDCSGSVAAVLAGAGLWAAGTGVPTDAGVIATLRREHLIVRGVGHGPRAVTLWDHRGVHIFMEIRGRFFGTSDGGAPSPENPRGGPGWLDDGAPDTFDRAFRPWHLDAAALAGRVDVGRAITVALDGALWDTADELTVGDRVGVHYATRHRTLVALAVNPL